MNRKTFCQTLTLFVLLLSGMSHASRAQSPGPAQCLIDLQASLGTVKVVSNDPVTYPGCTMATASAILSAGINTSTNLYFVDDVVINANITFTNCHVYVAPGKAVYLDPNRTLSIQGSTFQGACNEMWDGIFDNTTSLIIVRGSTIKHAYDALFISSSSSVLFCTQSTFTDDVQGIEIFNRPLSYPGYIYGNVFQTVGGLIYPYPAGTPTDRGIEIDGCKDISIGDFSTGVGNVFRNIRNGIHVTDNAGYSDVKVYNASFYDIHGMTTSSVFPGPYGIGISGRAAKPGSKVTVTSVGSVTNSSFYRCDAGISFVNIASNIRQVYMNDIIWGISMEIDGNQHNIEYNVLEDTYYGIYLSCIPANNSTIIGNRITTKTTNTIAPFPGMGSPATFRYPIGIWAENPASSSAYSNTCHISGNGIIVPSQIGVGIQLFYPGSGYLTDLNSVRLNPPSVCTSCTNNYRFAGIYSHYGHVDSRIDGNTVIGNPVTLTPVTTFPPPAELWEPSGITIVLNKGKMSCNNVSETRYGFQVRGTCTPSSPLNISGNDFEDHGVGMLFRFTGTSGGAFGANIGACDLASDATFHDRSNTFNGSYSVNAGSQVKICADNGSIPPPTGGRTIWTISSTLASTESIGFNPTFLTPYIVSGPASGPGYNCLSLSDIYACTAPYNFMIQNGYDPQKVMEFESTARGQNPDDGFGPASGWMAGRELYEYLYDHQDLLPYSAVLDSFYSSLQSSATAQIRAADFAYMALTDSTTRSDSALYSQAMIAAASAIAAIIPANQYEANEQDMTALMLKNMQYGADSFTTADKQLIQTLAYACPEYEGTAVSKAQGLFHALIGPEVFDYGTACDAAANGGGARKSALPAAVDGFRLYPNPANNLVTIEYAADPQGGSMSFEISNIFGQVVSSVVLPRTAQSYSIDLSGQSSGIYYYRLISAGKPAQSGKLVVNH